MSKISFSNKYLSKQNLAIGTMACLLVIVMMVLQLSNVDMQSSKTQGPRVVENRAAPKDEIDWNNLARSTLFQSISSFGAALFSTTLGP